MPKDIANPLAVAIRDVLWYKANVLSFYKECGLVPSKSSSVGMRIEKDALWN